MRASLRRKVANVFAAMVAVTGIGVFATPTPASADTVMFICNTFGNQYCIGAPDLSIGAGVGLTLTGRRINYHDRGYKCCGGYEVVQLQFASDTSRCVGIADTFFFTTVRLCSGGNGANVNWAVVPDGNGNADFLSTTYGEYLASDDLMDGALYVYQLPCNGCYARWSCRDCGAIPLVRTAATPAEASDPLTGAALTSG
jgi:hypothetical protein